jgi:hypothetical protein
MAALISSSNLTDNDIKAVTAASLLFVRTPSRPYTYITETSELAHEI